jgi:hypothetical protein
MSECGKASETQLNAGEMSLNATDAVDSHARLTM